MVNNKRNLKWGAKKRLEFLETQLYWSGRINRQDLMEHLGISKAQASTDLADYKMSAPENMVYDLTEKTYRISEFFCPQYINTSVKDFLEKQTASRGAESLPLPSREIETGVFRIVLHAQQTLSFAKVSYQSMSTAAPRERIIAPHTFVTDGLRWHVRAYDFLTNTFRDFLLARIIEAHPTGNGDNCQPEAWENTNDQLWNTFVELKISAHPGLSGHQKKIIEQDYGMVQGEALLPVRRACLPYLLRRLNLLADGLDPAEQQIVLSNRQKVLKWLEEDVSEGSDAVSAITR